jgi:hypothetical protein
MEAARAPGKVAARANSAMAEGFLGRWAQRKSDARQGKPLVEPEQQPGPTAHLTQSTPGAGILSATPAGTLVDSQTVAATDAEPEAPPLTLQDAQALGQDSDFKPFIARGVDPAVRNAAMKKLFADPHYNVMDRLDIYIDDYSQADPLPLSMLRKMASAQFLNLVDEEPESPVPAGALGEPIPDTITRQQDHAHTDLRLQPDHAPGEPEPGRGAE